MGAFRCTVIGLLIMLSVDFISANMAPLEIRTALKDHLFLKYDKTLAPSGINGTLRVNHTLSAASVVSLENNVLQLFFWNEMYWFDDRLTWNPDEYENETELILPSSLLWMPDILVMESIDPYNGFPNTMINVRIESNGRVSYFPPESLKTVCRLNEKESFSVNCSLTFLPWTSTCGKLDIHPLHEFVVLGDTLTSADNYWYIKSVKVNRLVHKYQCCPEVYCEVKYTLTLHHQYHAISNVLG